MTPKSPEKESFSDGAMKDGEIWEDETELDRRVADVSEPYWLKRRFVAPEVEGEVVRLRDESLARGVRRRGLVAAARW